jgi:chromosome segregation ATPase
VCSRDGLDIHITAVSAKLSNLSSELNDDLENRMVDIVSALPRTVTEIDRIEAAVRSLAKDLHQLTGALDAIHHGTNARVDLLARLDLTKSNMQVRLQSQHPFLFDMSAKALRTV